MTISQWVCLGVLGAALVASGCGKAEEAPAAAGAPHAAVEAVKPIAPSTYGFGAGVKLSDVNSLDGILGQGFSEIAANGSWTVGKSAILNLPVDDSVRGKALVVEVGALPFLHPPELPQQSVEVRATGREPVKFELSGEQVMSIPAQGPAAGPLTLEFAIATPTAPAKFDEKADPRELGFFLTSIAVGPVAQ